MPQHAFTVERVAFENPESGFAILRVRLDEPQNRLATALGELPGVGPGLRLQAEGEWVRHPKYGEQFRVESFTILEMHLAENILAYLASGSVEGIGPALAERIVDHFGDETARILDQAPHRLLEIRGIGKSTAEKIRNAWQKNRSLREIMIFLRGLGIGPGCGARIHRCYGKDTRRVVREEPYRMIRDIRGIGFATADSVAQQQGLEPEHPARINAGLAHVLTRAIDDGHLYLPRPEVVRQAARLLGVEEMLLEAELDLAIGRGEVIDDQGRIYAPELYACEVEVAERLCALAATLPRVGQSHRPVNADIVRVAQQQALEFSEQQEKALHAALEAKILVVTGGPGTGKTTITVGMIALFALRGLDVRLAAPTGRAARRLAEASGRPAATIHRVLLFAPESGEFARNESRPLECDALIIDEASMIDVLLMRHVLRALPEDARLILIGDVDQLPSVGPGTLLKDCITSAIGGLVVLDQIFRQDERSRIVINAHRINRGEMPDLGNGEGFFFLAREDPEEIAATITELVARRLPAGMGFHPRDEIQVITPMYRGSAGADQLNLELQSLINPDGEQIAAGQRQFRVGDKVMQLRNNYDKHVFNGDLGIIEALNGKEILVQFAETSAVYDIGDLDELTVAYAVTVHKSQGSEFPAVIMPVTTQHYVMLQRNLIYTALTRARQMVVLVGTAAAIQLAVRRDQVKRRFSALAERLSRSCPLRQESEHREDRDRS
jgi:exodeoxyribonuclease V alpha subunit